MTDYSERLRALTAEPSKDLAGDPHRLARVARTRAEMMAQHEGMTYERDAEKRAPYAQRSLDFIDRFTDSLSKKMVRKVKNRWGDEIWPWDREGFQRQMARFP